MSLEEVTRSAPVEAPYFVEGPWTHDARLRAVAEEVHAAYIEYFRKAVKTRNWFPWDDLPLAEMRERGHLLSEDTITLIQSFLGIEDYVGDYVADAINIVGKIHARRNIDRRLL